MIRGILRPPLRQSRALRRSRGAGRARRRDSRSASPRSRSVTPAAATSRWGSSPPRLQTIPTSTTGRSSPGWAFRSSPGSWPSPTHPPPSISIGATSMSSGKSARGPSAAGRCCTSSTATAFTSRGRSIYELRPNLAWEERASGDGKAFTEEARRVFPRTVALIERLPFALLGRCNLLGLQSNDHGTIHRDGEDEEEVGHFITLCPRADKRLFLWDEDERRSVPVGGRAYWFDDRNYHGVAADPFFRLLDPRRRRIPSRVPGAIAARAQWRPLNGFITRAAS